MKKLALIFTTFIMAMVNVSGEDNPGIRFKHISFEEGLDLAKAQNKMLFIHGFATFMASCFLPTFCRMKALL